MFNSSPLVPGPSKGMKHFPGLKLKCGTSSAQRVMMVLVLLVLPLLVITAVSALEVSVDPFVYPRESFGPLQGTV
jgi:hypothetical protein